MSVRKTWRGASESWRLKDGFGGRGWLFAITAVVCAVFGLAAPVGAATSAQLPPPRYQLIVYTSYDAPGSRPLVGHTFVDLKDTRTQSHVIVGKYPGGNNFVDGPGLIKMDGPVVWSWRITFDLTISQYRNAMAFVHAEQKHPSGYTLGSKNCQDWAEFIANDAGKTLPPSKDLLGIPSPRYFRDALQRAGSGNMLNGGRVQQNTTGSTASGAPDPPSSPPCCEAGGLMQAAATDPAGLTQELNLQLTDRGLAPDQLNPDESYAVDITHTNPSRSLYGIVWGDGSTTIEQRPNKVGGGAVEFKHTYQVTPGQPLRVFVLENGRLSEFDRTLQNPTNGSGHKEVDEQPPPGPTHTYP